MSLACMLTMKCLLSRYESADVRGRATYADPIEIKCWIEQREDVVKSDKGERRVTQTVIYAVEKLNIRDRIWQPGDYVDAATYSVSNSCEIEAPMFRPDPCGVDSHYEATLS